jgi:protoheme IX farnesyltransferase
MSATVPGPWLRLTALVAAAGTLLAVVSGAAHLGTAHRLLAALAGPPLVALAVAAWTAHRRLLAPTLTAGIAFALAALLVPRDAHIAFAAVAFAAALVATALMFRAPESRGNLPVPPNPLHRSASRTGDYVADYVTLTKPRIMTLLLLTGFCGMIVGARGWPGTGLVVATMVGLALACGGASALNHVLDADIDRLMGKRTEKRPVAAGRVAPSRALEFGLALSALSFVLLASAVNVVTAALALAGNLFYVLVYTRWLKRSTPQNIVIGGAAGAVPPLVGWAAATGSLTLPALLLFAIVFVWTPPHFWALALLIKENYAAARVPMLPVVRGDRETRRQILWYSLLMVGVSVLPFVFGTVGPFYLGAAIFLGAVFVAMALQLLVDSSRRRAALLFHYSLLYLALLFVAMALDFAL